MKKNKLFETLELLLYDPVHVVDTSATAWCYRHMRPCNVFDNIPEVPRRHPMNWFHQLSIDGEHELVAWAKNKECWATEGEAISEAIELGASTSSSSKVENKPLTAEDLELDKGFAEIGIAMIGNPCTDHCAYGPQLQDGGTNMITMIVWCSDTLVWRPTFLCGEVGGWIDITFYIKRLGHVYSFCEVWQQPFHQSVPAKRPRMYVWGWDRECAEWSGSAEEYHALCTKSCVMTGKSWFMVPDKRRAEYARQQAAKHGNHYQKDCTASAVALEHQMTGLTYRRFLDHVNKHSDESVGEALDGQARVTLLIDVHQNSSHSTGSWVAPPLSRTARLSMPTLA